MSEPNVSRPVRRVEVADHIWEAFEQMSLEMGTERDGLINQAMFMFARLNGFLDAGRPAVAEAAAPAAPERKAVVERTPLPAAAPAREPEPGFVDDPPGFDDRTPLPAPAPIPPARRPTVGPAAPAPRLARNEPPPPPMEPAPTKLRPESDSDVRRRMTEAASPSPDLFDASPSAMDNDPDRKAVAERVLETAAELERLIKGKQQAAAEPLPPPIDNTGVTGTPAPQGEKALYMMGEDGELQKIAKDRFLIGRGKHCDLIINSGKVSREHAVITHEGDEFFIEDLGSSNGTWFNKQRIKRRKIEDGDEYFVCSDKVKCVIR